MIEALPGIWIFCGWILGTAYFWELLDDAPWRTTGHYIGTLFLILFEGALLGPLVAFCFLLQPPDWFKKL